MIAMIFFSLDQLLCAYHFTAIWYIRWPILSPLKWLFSIIMIRNNRYCKLRLTKPCLNGMPRLIFLFTVLFPSFNFILFFHIFLYFLFHFPLNCHKNLYLYNNGILSFYPHIIDLLYLKSYLQVKITYNAKQMRSLQESCPDCWPSVETERITDIVSLQSLSGANSSRSGLILFALIAIILRMPIIVHLQ